MCAYKTELDAECLLLFVLVFEQCLSVSSLAELDWPMSSRDALVFITAEVTDESYHTLISTQVLMLV